MVGILMIAAVLCLLFWIGFQVTGTVASAIVWLWIQLPIAVMLWAIGVLFCCTVLLIPVGIWFFRAGASIVDMG